MDYSTEVVEAATHTRQIACEVMRADANETSRKPCRAGEQVHLTPAEARVLPFLATYLTIEGIADQLGVRRTTVKTHVVNIYKKLGVTNRAQAIQRAQAGGLLVEATPATRRRAGVGRAFQE